MQLRIQKLNSSAGCRLEGSRNRLRGREFDVEHHLRSALLHDVGGTPDLALDLFASPAGCLNGPGLELAVGPRLLDHRSEPILAEALYELSVGIGIGKITEAWSAKLLNTLTTEKGAISLTQ